MTSEGVNTAFFKTGMNKIELLTPTAAESPIAKFLEKKGEGIHHIAFDVADIVTEMARLKAEGFVLLNEVPKRGADNKLVCFVHPKGTNGVLIELCQEIRLIMEDFKSLSTIVNRDFEVDDISSESSLRERLIEAFAYLLDNDISKMMNILYRTDVDEEKLKRLLISNADLPSAAVIADAYISRQKEKVETRKKYSR